MTISSVNYNINTSYGAYVQRLSAATKQKLTELCIPFSDNTTEQEGRALIEKALKEKQIKNEEKNKQLQNNFSNKNDKDSLFEKAAKLAKQIGVEVPKNCTLDKLLPLIEVKLEEKIDANKNNVTLLKQLKAFSMELANIQAQSNGSSGYDNTNQALMRSLEVLSEYNKNFLNKYQFKKGKNWLKS